MEVPSLCLMLMDRKLWRNEDRADLAPVEGTMSSERLGLLPKR
jgi:hypothetical protein